MDFCAECGSLLVPRKTNSGKQSVILLVCKKCEYKKQGEKQKIQKINGRIIQHSPKQFVAVIGKEEQQLSTLPTLQFECPKCGNNTAHVWQVQTRGSDESSTQFFRCKKCNYTYREYT